VSVTSLEGKKLKAFLSTADSMVYADVRREGSWDLLKCVEDDGISVEVRQASDSSHGKSREKSRCRSIERFHIQMSIDRTYFQT
jgi:hypothetical protein